jgi:hypothetical protein
MLTYSIEDTGKLMVISHKTLDLFAKIGNNCGIATNGKAMA